MERWKSRGGKSQGGEVKKCEDQRGKKMQGREKVRAPWSKSNLANAAGAEPAGQMRDEKLHAVVARSTFPTQNVQSTSTPFSDHFWKLRCRKSARRCGAKHVPKSKVLKTERFGPFFDVQMSKKCTLTDLLN